MQAVHGKKHLDNFQNKTKSASLGVTATTSHESIVLNVTLPRKRRCYREAS